MGRGEEPLFYLVWVRKAIGKGRVSGVRFDRFSWGIPEKAYEGRKSPKIVRRLMFVGLVRCYHNSYVSICFHLWFLSPGIIPDFQNQSPLFLERGGGEWAGPQQANSLLVGRELNINAYESCHEG
jgi:hypothetical protein